MVEIHLRKKGLELEQICLLKMSEWREIKDKMQGK